MLSFSSIYNELQDDLAQQEAKLEMFAANNFTWLKKIREKIVDPNEIEKNNSEQVEKESNFGTQHSQIKESEITSETSEAFMLSSEVSKGPAEEFGTLASNNHVETLHLNKDTPNRKSHGLNFRSNSSDSDDNTPILKPCLRPSLHNQNMDSSSSDDSACGCRSNRHVSFGVAAMQDSDQQSSLISDVSDSSELSRTQSPVSFSNSVEENASNVTPQRPSIARKALHSSFDRISINARSHDSITKSDSPYAFESLSSESTASFFPSDSDNLSVPSPIKENKEEKEEQRFESPVLANEKEEEASFETPVIEKEEEEINSTFKSPAISDEKKGNSTPVVRKKKLVFADINDIRLSLDPATLLLTPDDLTTPSHGMYSVASHTLELSEKARINREKWAKMVEEKNKELREEEEKEDDEADDLQTPYQLSDHSSDAEDDDDKPLEEFESSAEEIHGKHIPKWARGELLEKYLEKQASVDPDTIFPDPMDTCQLSEVFGVFKARWQMRTDSAKWDIDGLTPEEIQRFKESQGIH